MLKVISNYYKFNLDEDNKDRISYLCELYLKTNDVDIDLYNVVDYFLKYYKTNKDFVSFYELKEEFKNFEFLNEDCFKDINEFIEYVKSCIVEYKKKYKINLINRYLNYINSVDKKDKRIEILDELLEQEVDKEEVEDLVEISEYSVKEILEKTNNERGIESGIEEMDEILKVGVLEGKILTIVAPPGCFKTSFALNMSYKEITKYKDSNVLFISVEIPKTELYMKYLVRHSFEKGKRDITYLSLKDRNNKLMEDILEIERDFKNNKKANLYIIDSNDLIFDNLTILKNMLIDYIDKYNIKTIYLDYIQLILDLKPKNFVDYREWGNAVVGILRYISVTKNCRIILLSQANTEGINRAEKTNGRFSLTNISELNTIKNHSYYIVTLYADDELKIANQFKWQIIKFRDGETKLEPTISNVYPNFYAMGDTKSYVEFKDIIKEEKFEDDYDDSEFDLIEKNFGK